MMIIEVIELKGDKFKIALIYVLIFIIIGLIGYLIYFVVTQNKEEDTEKSKNKTSENNETSEIASQCTFNMTITEFNTLDKSTLPLCTGLNKLMLTDVVLDGVSKPIYVLYSSSGGQIEQTGIYLESNRLVSGSSSEYKNVLGIFDNKLFVLASNLTATNVLAFDNTLTKIYDLDAVLKANKLTDPAFAEINKLNSNLETTLTSAYLDRNSMVFTNGSFTFNSTAGAACVQGQTVKGSSYKVTYNGNSFEIPQFVAMIPC